MPKNDALADLFFQQKLEEALNDEELLNQLYSFASDIEQRGNAPSLEKREPVIPQPSRPKSRVSINLRSGDMEASVCIYSPDNLSSTAPITLDELKLEISKAGVKYGIDWEIIDSIVENQIFDTIFIFAQGDKKIDGIDGKVTLRYDEVKKLRPKLLENGSVDFRDLGTVINIHAGDPICDIKKETEGVDGITVKGVVAPAIPGKKPNIPMGKNTMINGDETMLVAQKDGNLVYENGKFNVETEFVVKGDVDVSTGNICFIGDVIVKGNIEQGFLVESEKTVTVHGTVGGGIIKAKGDITIKSGTINAEIVSEEGNVSIGFGESSTIKCKGNCTATSLVSCNVECESNVEVVHQTGAVVGGNFNVYGNFTCNTLGHRHYIPTNIELGNILQLIDEKRTLEESVEKIDEEINKLETATAYFKKLREQGVKLDKTKAQFLNVAVRFKVQKANEKKPMLLRILEIDDLLGKLEKLIVKINRTLYPNVRISICGVAHTVRNEYGPCCARKQDDKIIIA